MKMIIFIICISAIIYDVNGWVATGITPNDKKIGHPDECWIDDEIGYIKNEHFTYCQKYICQKGGYFDVVGCGSVSTVPPCVVKIDKSLPHPGCCPKVVCPGDKS